jgi:hypothetical protein
VTVGEHLDQGRLLLRCKLNASSSLRARVTLGVLAGMIMIVLDTWVQGRPWLWALTLLLPLVIWRIEREKYLVRGLVAAVVREVIAHHHLVTIPRSPTVSPTSQAAAPDQPTPDTRDTSVL